MIVADISRSEPTKRRRVSEGLLAAMLAMLPIALWATTASAQGVRTARAPATGASTSRDAAELGAVSGSPGQSKYWSGYLLQGSARAFRTITAKWTVPAVAPSSGNAYSSTWIGIGGNTSSDPNLIQIGTEEDWSSGAAVYYAWWEIVPGVLQVPIPGIAVHPGDTMWASVAEAPNRSSWTLALVDTTTGATPFISAPERFSGKGQSAEWIQERPRVNNALPPLARFSTFAFDYAAVNGLQAHLAPADRVVLTGNNQHLSTPSMPDKDADGFSVAFGSATPAPPASGGDAGIANLALSSSPNPSTAGQQVTFTAIISPVPNGGTVDFIQDGTAIAGCSDIPVNTVSGVATCQATYSTADSLVIGALYSGDQQFRIAVGLSLVQVVGRSASGQGVLAATGHDMDYHCDAGDPNECSYLNIMVTAARNGSTAPILALDQGTELTAALVDAGFTASGEVVSVDPSDSGVFDSLPFVDGSTPAYSVIITASDTTCGGCDNTSAGEDNINARAGDFATYFDDGGSIIALAGADSTDYYDFLPLSVATTATCGSGCYSVTSAGSAIGITDAMVNCCQTHNSFSLPSAPYVTLETDTVYGTAETILANP
jgi:hypothetical protein